jgi:K+-sensing histidine kinase KdpD
VWNLLDNATKFTEKGSISIASRKENNHITITVKDNGSGIDSDVLPKLFTKFVTKSEKGTGLGLYISKSIIEAHGGKYGQRIIMMEKAQLLHLRFPWQSDFHLQIRLKIQTHSTEPAFMIKL